MMTGAEIKAEREKRGLSQADLAAAVGISQPAIKKIESGETLKSRYLFDIEQYFGRALPPGIERPPPQILGARDLPVYSAVEGGPGAMVVSTDPIEWVLRPWFLKEVKDGYAVTVVGESMSPVYEPGDIVIVNPRAPVIRGKNAIFVSGEAQGDFTATVKRLEKVTDDAWHVRQWNPPAGGKNEFTLKRSEWPKALRIVGKYEA